MSFCCGTSCSAVLCSALPGLRLLALSASSGCPAEHLHSRPLPRLAGLRYMHATQASDTCTRHTFPTLPGVARSVGALPLTDTQSGAALRCVQTHLHAHLCFLHKHLHRHMCLPGYVAPHSLGRWGPQGTALAGDALPGLGCGLLHSIRPQVAGDFRSESSPKRRGLPL